MFKRSTYALLAFVTLLLCSSCGYSLGGGAMTAPEGTAHKYVSVPIFVNDTYEPLVEQELTRALKEGVALDGRWVLTGREDAELVVDGRVVQFELQPLSYDPKERIQEYRLRVRAEVTVKDAKSGAVLWKDPSMESFADYRITEDVTSSKINKNEALKKASKGFADEFIIKVIDVL